jgi:hypothetical protein
MFIDPQAVLFVALLMILAIALIRQESSCKGIPEALKAGQGRREG